MRRQVLSWATVVLGISCGATWAQKSATESIEEYRAMLADGNPADLFEAKGEALWKEKRGPKRASPRRGQGRICRTSTVLR